MEGGTAFECHWSSKLVYVNIHFQMHIDISLCVACIYYDKYFALIPSLAYHDIALVTGRV